MTKRVAILGSTGSIGVSALDVIEHLGQPYHAVALSAHRQINKLCQQVQRHRPAAVAISDEDVFADSSARGKFIESMKSANTESYFGPRGLQEMVRRPDVDIVLAAIVGAAGLPAVFSAVRAGKTLALANKEALVVAGSLLIPEARRHNVPILPVDSEHSAIFQAMQAGRAGEIQRIILTASGGPFRSATAQQIENATLEDALNHPTWRMGNKITIDSATMFNKGLELIEACWLFDLPPEKIEIVIHPESIVHSMVEFVDGSVIAQLSPPDMRTPIQYALTYPLRSPGNTRRLDLNKSFSLNFHAPDDCRFPALRMAREVARAGGSFGAVLNAANEVAVAAFISGKIRFGAIARAVQYAIDLHSSKPAPSLDDLFEADRWAREAAAEYVNRHASENVAIASDPPGVRQ